MENVGLERYILSLEQELLLPQTRGSKKRLQELLAEDFYEFCSSGYIYYYDKNEIIDDLPNSKTEKWQIKDFKTKYLGEESLLATYILIKPEKSKNNQISLRSSVWKRIDGQWKMIFHQGTMVDSE